MATTFTLISNATVGSGGVADVTFTSIPATYTDLLVKFSARINDGYGNTYYETYIQLNSTTGTSLYLAGTNGSSVSGTSGSNSVIYGVNSSTSTANTFGNGEFYIPNYLSSANKSISVDAVAENNSISGIQNLGANIHSVTSAVTSVKMLPYNSPTAKFVQYSTFYLYGISNA